MDSKKREINESEMKDLELDVIINQHLKGAEILRGYGYFAASNTLTEAADAMREQHKDECNG